MKHYDGTEQSVSELLVSQHDVQVLGPITVSLSISAFGFGSMHYWYYWSLFVTETSDTTK